MGFEVSYFEADSTGPTYSLTMANQSAAPWTFYVYQTLPKQTSNIFSLAWFASPFVITVGSQITFSWTITYNCLWSAAGVVMPGVTFSAQGVIPVDPAQANTTTFSTSPGPNLSQAVQGPPTGSIVVNDAADVPNNMFSVALGMSGTGTYAVQAGPNLQHIFTPTPSYWIAAGQNVQVGTVLDIQTIGQTVEAQFPVNQFALTATLDQTNTWTIANS